MKVSEIVHFFKGLQDMATTGSCMPTSRRAGQALIREVARRRGPRRIVEVGAGTGAVTDLLVRTLRPGDHLALCEINPDYCAYLRRRFETEPAFLAVRDQVEVFEGSILDMPGRGTFDCLVSMVPLNTLPTPLVRDLLECYQAMLAPGGSVSYLEYAWIRRARLALVPGPRGQQYREAHAILEEFIHEHEVYQDFVWANVPPTWVRHFRFTPATAAEGASLRPVEGRHTLVMGPLRVAADAVGFTAGLGAAAWLLRRAGSRLWPWPLALAAGIATFLRDPFRKVPQDSDLALSACDGEVLAVERLRDPHLGDGEWLRISAFLSLFDVHVNRMPVGGRVADRFEVSGTFAPANLPKANHNHACYYVLDTPRGPVAVAQRVGLIARRIVNWIGPDELVAQGERFGLLRMGSRTDVYLPADAAEPLVQPGQRVVGGVTPLARYRAAPSGGGGPR